MFVRLFLVVFGAVAALLHAPVSQAWAADDDIAAKAQACAACHGEAGVPADPKAIPIIWGQQQSYLMKQLRDYRTGERDSPIMGPIAKELAEADLRKLAAYFAAKPWPAPSSIQGAKPAASAAPPANMAQCQSCHQPNFEGGMPAPRLAGLSYEYLSQAMADFASKERHNNLDMPEFMHRLSESDRNAMARYLSAL